MKLPKNVKVFKSVDPDIYDCFIAVFADGAVFALSNDAYYCNYVGRTNRFVPTKKEVQVFETPPEVLNRINLLLV